MAVRELRTYDQLDEQNLKRLELSDCRTSLLQSLEYTVHSTDYKYGTRCIGADSLVGRVYQLVLVSDFRFCSLVYDNQTVERDDKATDNYKLGAWKLPPPLYLAKQAAGMFQLK